MEQIEAAEIVRSPAGLDFNDAPQGTRAVSEEMVERQGHTAAIGMAIMAVAAFLSLQVEAICLKRGNELAGGNGTELRIFDTHTVTATTG